MVRLCEGNTADGKTAYKNIFGAKFDGPLILFGARVSYKPIFTEDESRLEEWIGTTRFQILKLPERYKWVHCRPREVQKTTRPDTICFEAQMTKKQKEEMGWISKMRGSVNAVYSSS